MLHIGGVRTALFNYLFARQKGGEFLLRIENTDTNREVKRAVDVIEDSLRWLGLDWDGETSFQMDRAERCREYAYQLLSMGKAYEDTDEEGRTAIRFRMPDGETQYHDIVRGDIRVNNSAIKDFVILRADGRPTYNFASPVDDMIDEITHVIRGEDHISNTAKQIQLLAAMGAPLPEYAHLPNVAGPDGKKLSKRHGAVGVDEFRAMGYIPAALLNFLAFLGWAPDDTTNVMTLEDLIERFDLNRVGSAMGRFDYDKLNWLNGIYLRQLPLNTYASELNNWVFNAGYRWDQTMIRAAAPLVQEKIDRFGAFPEFAGYLFSRPAPQTYSYAGDDEIARDRQILTLADDALSDLTLGAGTWVEGENGLVSGGAFTADRIETALRGVCETVGLKPRVGLQPIRWAVSGSKISASLFHSLPLLGLKETLIRIRAQIAAIDEEIKRREEGERA